jgi:hypothetical protein
MFNHSRIHKAADCEIDLKRGAGFQVTAWRRLRIALSGFAFSSSTLDRPRRSVDRQIQELDHTFD